MTLDLDGDGLQYVASSAGAAFDYDGDGVREATSWVGRGDGILVRDANGDGLASNGGEISFSVGGSTDLEGLRLQYDSNGNGQLDAEDAEFASFGVWQDANGNGITDAGEFRSLVDLGIARIALTSDGQPYLAADGEVIVHGEASFTRTDGSTGAVGDVSFITPRPANDIERAAGNQALTASLVAASLILTHEAQPDTRWSSAVVVEDESLPVAAESGVTVAAAEVSAGLPADLIRANGDAAHETLAPTHSATISDDDHVAAASLDSGDTGWRGGAGDDVGTGGSDALFDVTADRGSFDPGLMDGLLALTAVPTEMAAEGPDVAAHDPAAAAVLADVLESGAVDQLIDAVTGSGAVQVASGEAPGIDLAQFLDQKIAPDVTFPTSQPLEVDMHNMAAA